MCPPPIIGDGEITMVTGMYPFIDREGPFYRINRQDASHVWDRTGSTPAETPHLDKVMGALHPRLLLSEIREFMITPGIDGITPHAWLSDLRDPAPVVAAARFVVPATAASVDPNPAVSAEVLDLASATVGSALANFDPLRHSSTRYAVDDGQPIVGLAALIVEDPEAVSDSVIEALANEFDGQSTVLARVAQYAIAEYRRP